MLRVAQSVIPPLSGDGKAAGQEAEELGLRPKHILLRALEMPASLQANPAQSSHFTPWTLTRFLPPGIQEPRQAVVGACCHL